MNSFLHTARHAESRHQQQTATAGELMDANDELI